MTMRMGLGWRAACLLVLGCVSVVSAGCGAPQRQQEEAKGPVYLLMGAEEEQARLFVVELTEIVAAQQENPDQALARVRAYLATHRLEMAANARLLSARYEQATGATKRRYEQELAAFLRAANEQWRDRRNQFLSAHPQHGRTLMELLERVEG